MSATVPAMEVETRILVVDDDPDTLSVVAKLLERDGYEVATAAGVEAARRAAEKGPFDLLLCDIGLSDGDGCELLQELRGRYGLHGIAMTGYGMPEDLDRYRQAGFLYQLIKPITIAQLESAIQTALMRRQPPPGAPQTPDTSWA